jgi:cytochrome c5
MAKKIVRAVVPMLLVAGAQVFVACQEHHRKCRLVPVPTQASHRPEHVAENKLAGFRVVSPSIRCEKCHEPREYAIVP